MRRLFVLLLLIWALPALACLNDRDSDSLATQADKMPDTLRVITGRFERNPPLFYQMRIQRSLAQLKKTPREFGLYDDIAVAYDRLHREDEALQLMAQKRALLPRFDAKNAKMKDAWYRYYANAGTFHAHRFLGANSQKIKEIQTARDYIKRAIEIKPNAHFGREKYQLMTMEWILARKGGKMNDSLGEFLDAHEKWSYDNSSATQKKRQEAIEGLSGLIVLGAAWQSVDVFEALATSLQTKDGITLSYLSWRRTQELLNQGQKSISHNGPKSDDIDGKLNYFFADDDTTGINADNQPKLDALFHELRDEADNWNKQRADYMMARLEKGDHPDTNSKFWADWKPAAPPSLEVDWINEKQQKNEARELFNSKVKTAFNALFITILATISWGIWRVIKRRKLA